jgi:predicted type IV restriction endonuclease
MKFENYDFRLLNEADIREEIIAPFLRYLGYRSGTSANVIREQILKYPKVFLGRKDSKKDPELRGRADYICEVDKSIRWIIEAKPPQGAITSDDVEQAYTYANHPEIRAVYFCLINLTVR